MTVVTKNVGRLPGYPASPEYDSQTAYGRKQRCIQYGCEIESLVDNNTYTPFTWDGDEAFTLDGAHWRLISGNPKVWAAGNPKPASTGTTGDYPYNGMGRVVLEKNMVGGVNTLTQDMFYKGEVGSRVPNADTVFVVQFDFVLAEDITIPDGSVLMFDGGSISGGYTMTCNNTQLIGKIAVKCSVSGSITNKEIFINDFLDNKSVLDFQKVNSIIETLSYATIHFNGNYSVVDNEDDGNQKGITLKSNIKYEGNNSIINYPNVLWTYIFHDKKHYEGNDYVENIEIDNFNFVCAYHSESSATHHVSTIALGRTKNVRIANCRFNNWIGDAITTAYVYNPQRTTHVKGICENLVVSNCKFIGTGTDSDWHERNGIGILEANNVTIVDCVFKNMGNSAQPGCIDFEPEQIDGVTVQTIKDVTIKNCLFENNACGTGNITFTGSGLSWDNLKILGCTFKNCTRDNIALRASGNYEVSDCIFDHAGDNYFDGSILFQNNYIKGNALTRIGYYNHAKVTVIANTFDSAVGGGPYEFVFNLIKGNLIFTNNISDDCHDGTTGGDYRNGIVACSLMDENSSLVFIDNTFIMKEGIFVGVYSGNKTIKDIATKLISYDGLSHDYNSGIDTNELTVK